jgi:hypothetical protein
MDKKLKAKWIGALRSGDFEQGRQRLKCGDSYCCLGVLCEVAGLEIEPKYGNGIVDVPFGQDDYGPIYKLLGSSDVAKELWNRNDGLQEHPQHSFSEIADYIEKNL